MTWGWDFHVADPAEPAGRSGRHGAGDDPRFAARLHARPADRHRAFRRRGVDQMAGRRARRIRPAHAAPGAALRAVLRAARFRNCAITADGRGYRTGRTLFGLCRRSLSRRPGKCAERAVGGGQGAQLSAVLHLLEGHPAPGHSSDDPGNVELRHLDVQGDAAAVGHHRHRADKCGADRGQRILSLHRADDDGRAAVPAGFVPGVAGFGRGSSAGPTGGRATRLHSTTEGLPIRTPDRRDWFVSLRG